MSLGLFGYGSLVLRESASMTLGRPVDELNPVQLHDWRRRFSQRRDNLTCEKTFECDGGRRPRIDRPPSPTTPPTSTPCAASYGGCAPKCWAPGGEAQDLERRNAHPARELEQTRAKIPRGISTS